MKKGRMVKDGCKGSATFSVRFVVICCTSVTQLGICPPSFSCGTYFPMLSVWDSLVFGGMFAPRKDTSVWDQGMQLLKQLHDLTHWDLWELSCSPRQHFPRMLPKSQLVGFNQVFALEISVTWLQNRCWRFWEWLIFLETNYVPPSLKTS